MVRKKIIKNLIIIMSYVIIGFIFIFIYDSSIRSKQLDNNTTDINKSALVNVLESYYGEWEIVEDFGYHGIHQMTEIDMFQVGKSIFFQEDMFKYQENINVSYPDIKISMMSNASMQQLGMQYPHEMGFDNQYILYAQIVLYDSSNQIAYNIYVLDDTEMILEGDSHRYYRIVKKD